MGDAVPRSQRPNGGVLSRGGRGAGGFSVLTPPTGLPVVPDDAREILAPVPPDRRGPRDVPPEVPRETVVAPCVCGHGRSAHEHWRCGSDCGTCGAAGCALYRPRGGALRRLVRAFGLVP